MRVLINRLWIKLFILFVIILLVAGIFAITQESNNEFDSGDFTQDDEAFIIADGDERRSMFPEWLPPGPPRWFRSNSGGMTLEEIPSRLAALRNDYALVIDYVAPYELEDRLTPFYRDDYTIEIRILYERGQESRRQWLFRDEDGTVRLNAVFRQMTDDPPDEEEILDPFDFGDTNVPEEFSIDDFFINTEESMDAGEFTASDAVDEFIDAEAFIDGLVSLDVEDDGERDAPDEREANILPADTAVRTGFIEFYNDAAQITEDRWLFDDDSAISIHYFYNDNIMIRAETVKQLPGLDAVKLYTDNYRYNRSLSLRHVERLYHEDAAAQPVLLTFPSRVLEAAADDQFLSDTLSLGSDFLENFSAGEGFRMIYNTDSRGRILTQVMLDNRDEPVWEIKNTWSGDRIISILKIEGKDEKLTEYEYDNGGNRIVQRDLNNGVLERMVHTEGQNDIEELFLDGVMVLRAYWEDGRKIREERVRRQ